MDENQLGIIEEEEEVSDQGNTQSDLFSLLNNIKQPQLIDEEAANQTELTPDAYALSEVIKQLLPLLNGSCELYSDLRQRFVEQKLRQNHFSIQSQVIADFEPNASEVNSDYMNKLKEALARTAAHLRQLKTENVNTEIQKQETMKQLQSENENLRNELSNARRAQFVGSSSLSSPERASSSQVTFQSTIITPRTIRTEQSSQSSRYSPTSTSSVSPRPNNSSSLSPRNNNSSSLSPKPNNYSSLSPKNNNSSSLSPRPNNSSSLSPRQNNSPSLLPNTNNSRSSSSRQNNSSGLSPKPNDVSTLSQRHKNSSPLSAKSNHSSSSPK